MNPTYDELIEVQKFLVHQADNYVRELEIYCSQTLFRSENKSSVKEEIQLAPINSSARHIIVYLASNPVSFQWFPGKLKLVTEPWLGIPNEVVYRIPRLHGFLDMLVLDDYHALVRLEQPILRSIPVAIGEPLYSWYVGYAVDSNLFSPKREL